MGWSFKLHGGIAAGLSALLLVLAALTWLPGTLPLVDSAWLTVAVVLLLFPVCAGAMVRVLLTRADRHSVWLAFRCLPCAVQGALGSLVVSGVVVLLVSMAGAGNLQSAEIRDGRYFVLDTTPYERGRIEVSQSQYVAVLESDQRSMLAIPSFLFAAAGYLALAAGELRRADAEPRT
ncbi:hypothetical protein P1P68_14210 [Streptomyces scabiei]|uniref:hypothetical protein n=1 Tax=Streptomyces scabiei TaxID=1930 RepID=UPI00299068AF|nr:hypothetical protein [Streptomyces scabiei]MDW8805906.1 hypothetical protein [Streptomyces scabiei]